MGRSKFIGNDIEIGTLRHVVIFAVFITRRFERAPYICFNWKRGKITIFLIFFFFFSKFYCFWTDIICSVDKMAGGEGIIISPTLLVNTTIIIPSIPIHLSCPLQYLWSSWCYVKINILLIILHIIKYVFNILWLMISIFFCNFFIRNPL